MTINSLKGKRVAILATDGVEQSELVDVRRALDDAGARTELVSPRAGAIQASTHREKGDTFPVDVALEAARSADYAALYLPGGSANAEALRKDQRAVQLVREFMAGEKPVAAICHGAALLVEADVVAGRTMTSSPSLKAEIEKAGGEWVDESVCVDERLVTSRKPADIPAFNKRVVSELTTSINERVVDQASAQSFPASDPPPGPAAIGGTGASQTDVRP